MAARSRIDVIDAVQGGYRLVWAERRYLLALAAVPLLLKAICFAVIATMGWEKDFIRQALVMLPAYFAEGWMLAHFIRLIVLGQRWPFIPTGNAAQDAAVLEDRAHGIMRGTLLLVMTKFLMAGVTAFLYAASASGGPLAPGQGASVPSFLAALGLMTVMIWSFRLLWIYIPAAVNYPVRRYLRDLGGFAASLPLVTIWLFCFLPAFVVVGIFIAAFVPASGGPAVLLAVTLLRVFLDTIISLLVTAAIALGLKNFYAVRR